uniref:Histone H1.8 n=1 Tax=Bos mutus grunniens TaxID=30521 RepID=A0A8C0AJN5_BOSMU
MAPGSIASSDTSSSTSSSSTSSASSASAEGSSRPLGSEKPGLARGAVRAPRRHPPVLRMVLEALQAGERRRGTSVAAIKVYILQKYPTVDALRLNHLLKQALATGLHRGLLIRPVNSKAKGATGSFKLVPKDKRKIPPRKTAPRMPGQAEGKDPKKPSESKKDPANTVEVKKGSRKPREERAAPSKPGAAKKAPKKGTQTKDPEPRLGEAKKSSRRPDKAAQAPPSASGPGGSRKSKKEGAAKQIPRPTGKHSLEVRVQNPRSPRVRMVLPWPKRRWGARSLKRLLGRGPKPRPLFLPRVLGPRRSLDHWLGRLRPLRARESLASPPSLQCPKRPARRQKPRARGKVERCRFYFYSPRNYHSVYFTRTYLSIKLFPTHGCERRLRSKVWPSRACTQMDRMEAPPWEMQTATGMQRHAGACGGAGEVLRPT